MRHRSWIRGRVAAGACLALSVFAILLWGKLKLVTTVPRTAYAEPKEAPRRAPPPPAPRPAPKAPVHRPDLIGD